MQKSSFTVRSKTSQAKTASYLLTSPVATVRGLFFRAASSLSLHFIPAYVSVPPPEDGSFAFFQMRYRPSKSSDCRPRSRYSPFQISQGLAHSALGGRRTPCGLCSLSCRSPLQFLSNTMSRYRVYCKLSRSRFPTQSSSAV